MGVDWFALVTRAVAMFKQFPILSIILFVLVTSTVVIVFYMVTHTHSAIPIAVSRVESRWFGNYAGFFEENKPDDAQIVSFGTVTIANTSTDQRVALDLFLHITSKEGSSDKVNIRVPADLRSVWGIYGKDDFISKRTGRSPADFFANPVQIKPGDLVRKDLVFLFNFGTSSLRDDVTLILVKSSGYNFDLVINDLLSGRSISIRIPGEYRAD